MKEKSKKLNLFDLVSLGVGGVIGAGIFSMLGIGTEITGRSVALALVLAMFLVLIQQVRLIFVGSMFSLDGGIYAQQALVLPRLLTGMSTIIQVTSNLSLSVFGIAIASYLVQLFPSLAQYQNLLGAAVLTVFFLASIRGNKFMSRIENVMVITMYAALGLMLVYGFINHDSAAYAGEAYFMNGTNGFLMAIAIMSFTCNGTINLLNVTADTENAKTKIPKAILISTVVCCILYFLLGFVFTGCMPYSEVAGQNLGYVAQKIMPTGLYLFFIIGGAMFALSTSLLQGIAIIRHPMTACAKDGWLPSVFLKTTKGGFPFVIMGSVYLLTVIPVLFGFTLDVIVSFILVPEMVLGVICNLCSLKLPKQFPEAWKNSGLRCSHPAYIAAIILSTLASLLTAYFSLIELSPLGIAGNIAFTAIMFLYAWYRDRHGYVKLVSVESVEAK